MSDNIPEWLRPYCKQDAYTPTEEDIESLEPQSRKEMLLKYAALNSGGEEEDKYATFKARVDGSLTEVTAEMLQGITSIGESAFQYCTSLTSVTIPSGVTSIGQSAFYNCTSLTSIEIPNGVTSIRQSAFQYCTSLTSVEIPNSVTKIETNGFYNCQSLASVTVKATTPPTLGFGVFYNVSSNLVIYVPAESVDAYKAATNWSTYADKIQAIPNN